MERHQQKVRFRLFWALLAAVVLATVGGCGTGGGSGGTEAAKSPATDAPAPPGGQSMQASGSVIPTAAPGDTAAVGAGDSTAGTQTASVPPDPVQVDVENRRVYLAGQGWLGEDEFWALYYTRPQLLPDGFDPLKLHELGYRAAPPSAGGTP